MIQNNMLQFQSAACLFQGFQFPIGSYCRYIFDFMLSYNVNNFLSSLWINVTRFIVKKKNVQVKITVTCEKQKWYLKKSLLN